MNTFIAYYQMIAPLLAAIIILYEGWKSHQSKGILQPPLITSAMTWIPLIYIGLLWESSRTNDHNALPSWFLLIIFALVALGIWTEFSRFKHLFVYDQPKQQVLQHLENYLKSREVEYKLHYGGDMVSGDKYRIESISDGVTIKIEEKNRLFAENPCIVTFTRPLTEGRALKQEFITYLKQQQTTYTPSYSWKRIALSLILVSLSIFIWVS